MLKMLSLNSVITFPSQLPFIYLKTYNASYPPSFLSFPFFNLTLGIIKQDILNLDSIFHFPLASPGQIHFTLKSGVQNNTQL